jgi:hypothetical protein
VDQVQVDVVGAELLEGAVQGQGDGFALVARGFGGDVELGARDAGAGNGDADFGFVVIDWGDWLVCRRRDVHD